ncbi:hypothetical protein [Lactiplantibacillus plantarum]|uniref:hypothetical protein n=1 Tax=Lactiplantibacillus plantarum TaxID=1590 RepID=UPI000DAE923B|nr:hypothetical protein [Lactiplantibacillus plantarum]KAF1282567.1 hypothetical protein CHF38_12295 [Lactiplantibacillus plantarum]MDY8144937.1 hypothetical protein [Lactiplantibacillus plantarum]RAH94350.1 hypothetical protein DAY22_12285 [Lactiplantibacillus plantarum]
MESSHCEHEMALYAAQAMTISDIAEEKDKAKSHHYTYDARLGIEIFEDNYKHALEHYSGRFPD